MITRLAIPDDRAAAWARAGIAIDIAPLHVRPRDPAALLPAGAAELSRVDLRTDAGWPYKRIDRADALIAVFDFHGDVGVVAITGSPDAIAAHRAELGAVLATATPDWRGPIVALAQLWT
jgi:hypothetical protein